MRHCEGMCVRGNRKDDAPVTNVSWTDAKQFVAWLAAATRKAYRLPSEAEWEYAARGGTQTRYWWGDQFQSGMANCKNCNDIAAAEQPIKVGSFKPNPFGLYDMGGGVDQWVEDCWRKNYQGAPADGSAWVEAECRLARYSVWFLEKRRPLCPAIESRRLRHQRAISYSRIPRRTVSLIAERLKRTHDEDRPADRAVRSHGLSVICSVSSRKAGAKGCPSLFRVPQDGASIKGGFWCRFGLRNMGVTHAGDNFKNSGHHHLLIDVNEPLDSTNRFHKTSHIFILERAKPRRVSNFHPAGILCNWCWVTPIIIRSTLRSFQINYCHDQVESSF